jgi:hypothetical protein
MDRYCLSIYTTLHEQTESARQPHHCATIIIQIACTNIAMSLAESVSTEGIHYNGVMAPLPGYLAWPLATAFNNLVTLVMRHSKYISNKSYTNFIPSSMEAQYWLLQ